MDGEGTMDLNQTYLDVFKNHVAKTREYLQGLEEDEKLPLESSTIDGSLWTTEQKNFFFAALNRHGRFFVDAIAEEVPGKSVAEVQNYLFVLRDGAKSNPSAFTRDSFKTADESSKQFIKLENENARIISSMEPIWAAANEERDIHNKISIIRYELRKEYVQTEGKRDKLGEMKRNEYLAKLEEELLKDAKVNNFKNSLSAKELRACDSIIHDIDELRWKRLAARRRLQKLLKPKKVRFKPSSSSSRRSLQRVTTSPKASQTQAHTAIPLNPGAESTPSSPSQNSMAFVESQHTERAYSTSDWECAIDPILLMDSQKTIAPTQLRMTAVPTLAESIPSSPCSTQVDTEEESQFALEIPEGLSKEERRRFLKRMYMRRKRAEIKGSQVSASIVKLKPGRKLGHKLKNRGTEDFLASSDADTAQLGLEDVDTPVDFVTYNLNVKDSQEELVSTEGESDWPGLPPEIATDVGLGEQEVTTLSHDELREEDYVTYKSRRYRKYSVPELKKELKAHGLNGTKLKANGLSFFHLKNMGRLMKYNASFSSKVQDPSARIGTCISAKTIQLFHAETACFLSEVLQFVIGLHETRQLLIDESEDEAENNSNQPKTRRSFINGKTVRQALDLMGLKRNKIKHFKYMARRLTAYHDADDGNSGGEDIDSDVDRDFEEHDSSQEEVSEAEEEGEEGDSNSYIDGDGDESMPSDISGINTSVEEPDEDLDKWAVSHNVEVPEPLLSFPRQLKERHITHDVFDISDPFPYRAKKRLSRPGSSDSEDTDDLDSELKCIRELEEERNVDGRDMARAKYVEEEFWKRVRAEKSGSTSRNTKGAKGNKRKRGGERQKSKPRTGSRQGSLTSKTMDDDDSDADGDLRSKSRPRVEDNNYSS